MRQSYQDRILTGELFGWRGIGVATLLQQITKEIEEKRYELFDINKRYGLLHSKTIQCSQELDKLLNQLFKERHVGMWF
ncbi:aspartyl-phosphate phosphatase Spo0E family protein [Bacillus sp. AFS029533]|nr:aspartyl-phosphate phosphatase Spo0E family protein [Bacillus sp. AFS096315]PFH87027.1 aspartyl-phosphate phosphatase Spo0E family protein [Bacillus sp. AFS088145]PGZ91666.1 aspartyl-phosphate phosphatase Spo0E family protein [Bacillus sp. AFS029533]